MWTAFEYEATCLLSSLRKITPMGDIFTLLLVQPITNVLVIIYQGLVYIHAPYALGFAIILLTVVIRLILFPLMGTQLRSMKKMQLLNPKLADLKEN
jgi:YidC/Oxa1 family membrane protein insertase